MTVYLGKTPVGIGRVVEKKVAKKKFGATVDTFLGDVDENGVLQSPTNPVDMVFTGVKNIAKNALAYKFQSSNITSLDLSELESLDYEASCRYMCENCQFLTSVNMSNITKITEMNTCQGMFNACSNLSHVQLNNLTEIIGTDRGAGAQTCGTMFQSCKSLTEIDLNKLETITGSKACSYMFNACSALQSVGLASLKTIYGANYMFNGCSGLTSVDLSSLETISGYQACYRMFNSCSKLSSVNLDNLQLVFGGGALDYFISGTQVSSLSFPSLTSVTTANAIQNMGNGASKLTEIHFRADMQATIEALTGYSSRFGAPSTCTIYFDL